MSGIDEIRQHLTMLGSPFRIVFQHGLGTDIRQLAALHQPRGLLRVHPSAQLLLHLMQPAYPCAAAVFHNDLPAV